MSVEAGLERISKEEFNEPEAITDLDLEHEQYSMIIKNIEDDEADYAFASQLDSPVQDLSQLEETNNDEDVMT
eukprot:CAMPEP_0205809058 /NCGR_PEP_ID=MMETSP0205-20121125/13178_1 /ASSEMBLY_ACC=CAM_ASM_000278 /TAXON_ID=36767 /ORGANISM="Euplotes focardii, Strain TN1" /LENGTH=72 /DNA_ID=CAMNT_0053085689 /DNA_START=404 /DNA_END=618 /DNA_ORIENTATION=+